MKHSALRMSILATGCRHLLLYFSWAPAGRQHISRLYDSVEGHSKSPGVTTEGKGSGTDNCSLTVLQPHGC